MCPTCHTMGARPPGRAAASSSDTSWRACSSHWAVNSNCLRISCLMGLNTSLVHISALAVQDPLSFDADRRSVHHHFGSTGGDRVGYQDRKSTRLNSSHVKISYAVFCLKKKKPERLS